MEFEQHGTLIDETHEDEDSELNEHPHYHKEKSQYRKQKSGNEVAETVKLFDQLSTSERSGSKTSNDSFAEFIDQHVDPMTYKEKKRDDSLAKRLNCYPCPCLCPCLSRIRDMPL